MPVLSITGCSEHGDADGIGGDPEMAMSLKLFSFAALEQRVDLLMGVSLTHDHCTASRISFSAAA